MQGLCVPLLNGWAINTWVNRKLNGQMGEHSIGASLDTLMLVLAYNFATKLLVLGYCNNLLPEIFL